MPRLIDVTGERFGRLTVIGREEGTWKCLCDCGEQTFVTGGNLRSGRQQSCGCLNRERTSARFLARVPDETGQRYGRLVVVEKVETQRRSAHWLCRCDCGNEVVVRADKLRGGLVESCGCWRSPSDRVRPTGEAHHRWKGEDVGYNALHIWLAKHKAKTGQCSRCGARRYTEWANTTNHHSRDLDDYIEVCKPCHMELDGHPWIKR